MVGESHETHPEASHKEPGLTPPSASTAMTYLGGVIEEDERILLNCLFDNQTESPGPVSELSRTRVKTPASPVIIPAKAIPLVTRKTLAAMDGRCKPPPIPIVHEMIYEGKVNLSLEHLRLARPAEEEEKYWSIIKIEWDHLKDLGSAPSLSHLLDELQNMIFYLYGSSQSVQDFQMAGMSGDFIVGELARGSLSVPILASKLKELFQENCAPKRDLLVQSMYFEGLQGDLISMLRIAMNLVELMKLDLLNYSVRKSRCQFLADLPNREKQLFDSILDETLVKTKTWIEATQKVGQFNGDCELVATGLSMLITNSTQIPIPETLSLDVHRIQELQRGFESMLILGTSLIVSKKWVGKDPNAINELKIRLHGLLGFPGSRMDDISNQIALVASRKMGFPLKEDDRKLLRSIIDKVVHPKNPIYIGIKQRMSSCLIEYMLGGAIDQEKLKGCGLNILREELESLFVVCRRLWIHHWTVHKERYKILLQ